MTPTIAFAPVGSLLRELWVRIGKTLSNRGDDVYFFDPNPILSRYLRREGMGNSIVRFDSNRSIRIPLSTDRDAHTVDFVLRMSNKEYDEIRTVFAEFAHYLDRLEVDTCLFWNDYRSVGSIAARECDVQCVYMENGYEPDTIQIDDVGVNRNSRVTALSERELRGRERPYSVSEDLPVAQVDSLARTDEAIGFGRKAITEPKAAFRSIKHRIPKRGELLPGWDTTPNLPQSFVFVPFQVHDDTQIRYNSPIVGDMRAFLTLVRQAVDAVAPDTPIVVKEHPVDRHRIDYGSLRSQFPDVYWLSDYPIADLTSNATVVMTVNSSVGFQSLAKGTPVVTVGASLYDSAPNVWSARSRSGVRDALDSALSADIAAERIAEYVQSVREALFIPGTPHQFSDETVRHVVGYIDYVLD